MRRNLTGLDSGLIKVAASACAKQDIDFDSLDRRAQRGLICYWCSTCRKVYPLTELSVGPRRIKCGHCHVPVKLYSNSNRFGKLRKIIFYKLVDMGRLGV
jgi:DNA-directed RNA polymerase subunit RPC12/RpoP